MGLMGRLRVNNHKNEANWLFCLIVWGFSYPSRIFHLYGNVTITSEGLQILTYYKAWHSWPMSSEGCLACHIYCDTGQPFMMTLAPVAEF